MKKKYRVIILQILILIFIISINGNFLIGVFWITLHELSHIVIASSYGCKFNNFKINVLGAKAEICEIEELSEKRKLNVYLAGPCFNFIIAMMMYILNYKYNLVIFENSVKINLSLGLFNLLPAYPLDGSRICEILLTRRYLYRKTKSIVVILSIIISIMLFLFGTSIMIFLHKVNISFFMASVLMIYTSILEKQKTMYIIMGDIFKKLKKLKKYGYIENKSISIYYKKGLVNVLTLVDKNKFNIFYVLDDNMKVVGTVCEDELIEALKEYGNISLEEYMELR
ncbi:MULTISPECIES: site-2 protease family protein [Clostridium]|uniref:Stage IV sporulation protein FB n=2 Tax=Clostridium TaxID=1485 RepID=A0AAD1YDM6_9CLOT|nr:MULTISPECIES: site-2 protease family protein [Clostridium]CAI3195986.1 stage IV sporulation protein FB [Clostridium neonatale]CAI3200203.1 stage IV sporulation protein FB [Clostridium neonatale]CAI3215300.1 stage IV sporulation protein FB [Clostridium neonatale]CAI3219704.1 stage IV sporulation protein FB [Clostridium neonatale]CAI3221800.1 stage IV sporulation protein FB [Clostridium neonatale]